MQGFLRAVKNFLSGRKLINSRQFWNSHQSHKFLRVEASRDILKFRVLEMVFPGGFQEVFSTVNTCCFVRIQARLGKMPSKLY